MIILSLLVASSLGEVIIAITDEIKFYDSNGVPTPDNIELSPVGNIAVFITHSPINNIETI